MIGEAVQVLIDDRVPGWPVGQLGEKRARSLRSCSAGQPGAMSTNRL